MRLIVEGAPQDIQFVTSVCREKVRRGLLSMAPAAETALDAGCIATLREDLEAKTKACMEMATSQVELACIIDELVNVITEEGITISKELADRLAKFGVTVPKSAETVPNELEVVEDNKTVDAGTDMKEVNLDDVKDAPEVEAKAEPAPAPKKKRSKKSE